VLIAVRSRASSECGGRSSANAWGGNGWEDEKNGDFLAGKGEDRGRPVEKRVKVVASALLK